MRAAFTVLLASSAAASTVTLLFASREVAHALSGGQEYALEQPMRLIRRDNATFEDDDRRYYTANKFLSCSNDANTTTIKCLGKALAYPWANDVLRKLPMPQRFVLVAHDDPSAILRLNDTDSPDVIQSVQIVGPKQTFYLSRWHSLTRHTFVEPSNSASYRLLSEYQQTPFDLVL